MYVYIYIYIYMYICIHMYVHYIYIYIHIIYSSDQANIGRPSVPPANPFTLASGDRNMAMMGSGRVANFSSKNFRVFGPGPGQVLICQEGICSK